MAVSKKQDIINFLQRIRERRSKWILSNRRKNLLTLAKLGIDQNYAFDYIYQELTWKDYVDGPISDDHYPPIPGDIWIFGLQIDHQLCYLKVQDRPDQTVMWISLHKAEFPIKLKVLLMKKTLYNPELKRYDSYTEVWLPEKIDVKDEKNLKVVNHYWKDSQGELWGDFQNPMENVHRSFAAYRKKKGYLTPEQIRQIRENLKLSVRKFADALGISPSALTQIENNHKIQTKYQDILFKNVQHDPDFFKNDILKMS